MISIRGSQRNVVRSETNCNSIDKLFLIALAKVASTFSGEPCMHIWNENVIVAAAVIIIIASRPFSDA